MRNPEVAAPIPSITTSLAKVLPQQLRWLSCIGVHTIPPGYSDRCLVCQKKWTGGRKMLRFHGTRSPSRKGRPSEVTLHIEVFPGLSFHRVSGMMRSNRWQVVWTYQQETHSAFVKPSISFNHRNITRQIRLEKEERERELAWEQDE